MKFAQAITIVLAFAAFVSLPLKSVNSASSSGNIRLDVVGLPDFSQSYMEAKGERLSALQSGDIIIYEIIIKNTGDADSHNTFLTSEIPVYTSYIKGSATGASFDESNAVFLPKENIFSLLFFKEAQADSTPFIKWNLGTVKIGETLKVSYRVKVDPDIYEGVSITNNAYIESDEVSKISYSALTASVRTGERVPYLVTTGASVFIFSVFASIIIALFVILILRKANKKRDKRKNK